MIKLGVCADIGKINQVARAGFDYLECSLTALEAMPEGDYQAALDRVSASPIKVEAVNGMLPATLPVTGNSVNAQNLHDYLEKAFDRARRIGVRVAVFGSGGARRLPEGFDTAQGWRQIANFLRLAERHAADNDIVIAIEPLRSGECNILNYVSEAVCVASIIQMPHIAVLADTYHMAMGGEGFGSIRMAGDLLKHVHTANAIGRRFPKTGDGEKYQELFDTLREIGYQGRVSVEGGCDDFETDCKEAFRVLNAVRG